MSANIATFEEIVETVQRWPAAQRYSLAQILFRSLEPELKQVANGKKNTVSNNPKALETVLTAHADTDEFEILADQLADEFAAMAGPSVPMLSDYAMSRASIYEDHD